MAGRWKQPQMEPEHAARPHRWTLAMRLAHRSRGTWVITYRATTASNTPAPNRWLAMSPNRNPHGGGVWWRVRPASATRRRRCRSALRRRSRPPRALLLRSQAPGPTRPREGSPEGQQSSPGGDGLPVRGWRGAGSPPRCRRTRLGPGHFHLVVQLSRFGHVGGPRDLPGNSARTRCGHPDIP